MSEAFDPYHKWLGIPPSEQPANHYRLLGVALFEQDADVIDSAANQRMAYLQDMATGPQVEDSQRILNEISAARLCLLSTDRKTEYDNQLKQEIAAKKPASTSDAETQPAAKGLSPMVLISAISVSLITLTIALVMIFKGGGDAQDDKELGTLLVTWKVTDREGAYVMIGPKVVIDSKTKKLPPEEVVAFKVKPSASRIEFSFERKGHKPVIFKYKFIPGEVVNLGLNWRKR